MKAGDPEVAATSGAIYLSNRCVLAVAAITCLLGCAQKVAVSTASLTATYDQSGYHPATVAVTGVATVSCSSGSGNQGNSVDCLIVAPGSVGEVPLGKSAKTTGAGTVMLNCSGQGRCTAVVVQ
jgi:hypothetical protein